MMTQQQLDVSGHPPVASIRQGSLASRVSAPELSPCRLADSVT